MSQNETSIFTKMMNNVRDEQTAPAEVTAKEQKKADLREAIIRFGATVSLIAAVLVATKYTGPVKDENDKIEDK